MANVNDGSAIWSLENIYNAEQLNGYTAEQIKEQVNIPVKEIAYLYGYISFVFSNGQGFVGATIPVPDGYEREKCWFFIQDFAAGNINTNFVDVNNKKGIYEPDSSKRFHETYSVKYSVIGWR